MRFVLESIHTAATLQHEKKQSIEEKQKKRKCDGMNELAN